MNIFKKVSFIYLLTKRRIGLLLLAIIALPVQAMTTFTFNATVNDGSVFDGTTGYGSVTYDETWLNSGGTGSFAFDDPVSAFDISLTIFGQTFGRGDDIDRDDFGAPEVYIANGVPNYLSFVISEVDVPDPMIDGGSLGINYTPINDPQILAIAIYNQGGFVANPAGSAWDYSVGVELITAPIPVPAAAWLFVSACASLVGVASRRRAQR